MSDHNKAQPVIEKVFDLTSAVPTRAPELDILSNESMALYSELKDILFIGDSGDHLSSVTLELHSSQELSLKIKSKKSLQFQFSFFI
jgi:hypothetical protein